MGFIFSKGSAYVSRDAWNAMAPIVTFPFKFPIQAIFVTAISSHNTFPIQYKEDILRFLRDLQKCQVYDEGYPDIAHNFYVGADARIYEGRGWAFKPSLTEKENPNNLETIAITYVQHLPRESPTNAMVLKVKDIIKKGLDMHWIQPNYYLSGITNGVME